MHKTAPAQIKAAGTADGLAEGQFRALVSVFGNKDSYGDVIRPGAFTDTLADWESRGEAIPVYFSHQMQDPTMNIGWVVEAKETDEGLEVLAELDLAEDAPPTARYVHRLLKRPGGVREFSFAYDVIDGSVEKDESGEEFYELRKLKLYEVGPTQVGANPATELLAVKRLAETAGQAAAEFKAGRVLSAKNEQVLKDALDSLQSCASSIKNVLAAVADSGDDGKAGNTHQEQVRESDPATDKEPPGKGATAKEPGQQTPTARLAAHLSLIELEGAQS
jgi:uncharacterized protein